MTKKITLGLLSLFLISCASKGLVDPEDVKVSRDNPAAYCEPVGKVRGRVMSHRQGPDDALRDLKKDAANKGANYIQVAERSDHGTSITGHGFICDTD